MYALVLTIHSLMRWVVLAAGVAAFTRAFAGSRARRPWTTADGRAGLWFTIAIDTQLVLGLLLYVWLSPITSGAFDDFGGAMRNSVLRFWAVEHLFGMVAALALAHVGRARARRARDAAGRHRTSAIFFGLALLAIVLTIPWPGMPAARPLFRGF